MTSKKDVWYVPLDISHRVKISNDFSSIVIDNKEYSINSIIPVLDCLFIHYDIRKMLKELGIPEDVAESVPNQFSSSFYTDYLTKCAYRIIKEAYENTKIEDIISKIDSYIPKTHRDLVSEEISAESDTSTNRGFYVPYEPAPYSKLRSPIKPEFLEISYNTNYVIMTPSAMALLSWVKESFVDFMKDKYNVIIEVGTQSAINEEIKDVITVGSEISAYYTSEIAHRNLYSILEKEYVHTNKGIIVSAIIVPIYYIKEDETMSGKILSSLPNYPIKLYKEIWKVVKKPKGKEEQFPNYYAYISAYGTARYIKVKSKVEQKITTSQTQTKQTTTQSQSAVKEEEEYEENYQTEA
jgi:thiaminase